MALTVPKVAQLEIGIAHGYWDFRGRVDFGTGVITLFPDDPPRTGLPAPTSAYFGDVFSEAPFVLWSIIHPENSGVAGGASDQAKINIGASGSSAVSNVSPATTGDTGTLWDGTRRLIQEGGIVTSPFSDINFGFGVIIGSNGTGYYLGRIGFLAIGKRIIP